jgi:hypothetical protein
LISRWYLLFLGSDGWINMEAIENEEGDDDDDDDDKAN